MPKSAGEPVAVGAHEGGARSAAFAPAGARVVSTGYDDAVRVWADLEPLRPGDARLWRATSYCLTPARRQELLGLAEHAARAGHDACLARAPAARAPAARAPGP